jgi:hypothetical protein
MAKKTKKKKSTRRTSRRSRGRALGAIDTTNLMGVVAGAIGSKFLDKVIPASLDPKLVAGGKVALGVFLPNFVKDGKTKAMLSAVGNGMIAVGAVELMTQFGVLSGVEDTDLLAVSLEGIDDLPVVNGTDDLPVVNGDMQILAGDATVLAGDEMMDVDYILE